MKTLQIILRKSGIVMDSLGTKEGILLSKKLIFLKKTLVYCNQGTVSTFKAGDYAIYLDYVILGQLILANNCPDLDNYKLKEDEVMIYAPLYNTENGYFRGFKKWLAYKMVRDDLDGTFFSYGHDKEGSKTRS